MQIANPARARLERDQLSLGVGLRQARTVDIAKAMATAGFDWLFIDLEHGSIPLDVAAQISCAALEAGISPIVRAPHREYGMATRALDSGAIGIVMPHVDTADEAREVVARLRFPPIGHRSVGYAYAQLGFRPLPTREAAPLLNAATLVTVMLETPTAISNAEAIAAVEGIDVLMIGTNDLCAEYGVPSEFDHPDIVSAYRRVIDAARRNGKWIGMGGVPTELGMKAYIDMGVRFILAGADFGFMMSGAVARAGAMRAMDKGQG